MLKNYVLLITGCIQPNPGVPFLEMRDYEIRRKQYIDSIKFYIEKTNIKNIVYCDNSLAKDSEELNELAKRCSKNFEWLSFMGDNAKAIAQGKGYGEGEIIEYALNHSTLLCGSRYFIKVTGRVIIRNIGFLLPFISVDKLYFYRNSSVNIDTKFYGTPIETYKKYFLNLYKDVDDKKGKYLENLFSDEILQEHLNVHNFAVFPNAQGVSGSTGESYAISLKGRIKLTIKTYLKM